MKARPSKNNLKEIFSNQTLNNYNNKTSNQKGKPKGMIQHETVVDANISRDFNEKIKEFREKTNLDDLKSPSNARNKFHKGQDQRTVPRNNMSLFEFDHGRSLDKDFRDFRMLKENCKSSFKKLGEYTVKRDFIDLQRQYHRQTKVSFRSYSDSLHRRPTSDPIPKQVQFIYDFRELPQMMIMYKSVDIIFMKNLLEYCNTALSFLLSSKAE